MIVVRNAHVFLYFSFRNENNIQNNNYYNFYYSNNNAQSFIVDKSRVTI